MALLIACISALSGCSSDNNDKPDTGITDTDDVLPAARLARSAIHNGYYLSRSEEFGSDGSSLGGYSYTLNSAERQVEGRDLDDETLIVSLYKYNDAGDIISVSILSDVDALAPIGTDIQRIDVQRTDGVLQTINVDYLIGNEEDNETSYTYDSAGRIVNTNTQFLDSNATETLQYNYENGVLVSISGNDVELPNVAVTETIARDSQGRVNAVTTLYDPAQPAIAPGRSVYLYDQNNNVSEIQFQADDGSIDLRQVFTYESTTEPVFNLPLYDIYFAR